MSSDGSHGLALLAVSVVRSLRILAPRGALHQSRIRRGRGKELARTWDRLALCIQEDWVARQRVESLLARVGQGRTASAKSRAGSALRTSPRRTPPRRAVPTPKRR